MVNYKVSTDNCNDCYCQHQHLETHILFFSSKKPALFPGMRNISEIRAKLSLCIQSELKLKIIIEKRSTYQGIKMGRHMYYHLPIIP